MGEIALPNLTIGGVETSGDVNYVQSEPVLTSYLELRLMVLSGQRPKHLPVQLYAGRGLLSHLVRGSLGATLR